MKAKFRKELIVIKMPRISPARPSKSGKTLLVATSVGPRRTSLRVDGKPVIVSANAWIHRDKPVKSAKGKRTPFDRPIGKKAGKPSFKKHDH
jgi:hypothetical protein